MFRKEIGGRERHVYRESYDDDEDYYLSLEFQNPRFPKEEEASPKKNPPIQALEQDEVKGFNSFHWTHAQKQIRSPLILLHHEERVTGRLQSRV